MHDFLRENSSPTKQDETHTSVHDAHEEIKDDTTETISVKIKRVGSASSAKSAVESEGESKVQAEAPPLPSVPGPAERPPSSKSVRSMKSADVKKHPMEFLTDRRGAEVGVSPTAELESMLGTAGSAAASVADTAGLSRAGSPRAPSEWEDLNRTKSQMSWASSREVIYCHPHPSFAVGLESPLTVFCRICTCYFLPGLEFTSAAFCLVWNFCLLFSVLGFPPVFWTWLWNFYLTLSTTTNWS